MAENKFTVTAESLFNGMNTFVSTKTVVGEPQRVGDAIIIPLVDVSCGMAVGSFAGNAKDNGAGGMSTKMPHRWGPRKKSVAMETGRAQAALQQRPPSRGQFWGTGTAAPSTQQR